MSIPLGDPLLDLQALGADPPVDTSIGQHVRIMPDKSWCVFSHYLDMSFSGATTQSYDDAQVISWALANIGAGGAVQLAPGLFTANSTIVCQPGSNLVGLGRGPLGSTAGSAVIQQAAGANLNAVISDTSWTSLSPSPAPASNIRIAGVAVDGNTSAQTGGTGHGIVLMGHRNVVLDCLAQNTRGAGIVMADQSATGNNVNVSSTLVENAILRCRTLQCGTYCVWVQKHVGISDGYLYDLIANQAFGGSASFAGVQMDSCGGWRVCHNHVYALLGDGYDFPNSASGAYITDNRVDNFGQAGTGGQTYYGYNLGNAVPGSEFSGNQTNQTLAGGGGNSNWVHFAANGSNLITLFFFANIVAQSVTNNGTTTGYQFTGGGGGGLAVQLSGPLSAPAQVGTPVALTGTVTFPGYTSNAQFYGPANPASTTSATPVMAGLGFTYTPKVSGKLLVQMSGAGRTLTAAVPMTVQMAYGTGTPPVNGAAATGTTFGPQPSFQSIDTTHNMTFPQLQGVISGLTPGTTYWIDLQFSTSNAADAAQLATVTAIVQETS